MKQQLMLALMTLALTTPAAFAADDSGWETYQAKDYGFSMLVPTGTTIKTKEWDGGWGGLFATHEGVTVYGIAKLGEAASAKDIEMFGVKLTGIPADSWTEIDKGEGNGWTWYRTVKAMDDSKLVFGGYGVGPKGSYLLLLVTTPADFKEYQADYQKWYDSIELH